MDMNALNNASILTYSTWGVSVAMLLGVYSFVEHELSVNSKGMYIVTTIGWEDGIPYPYIEQLKKLLLK